MRVLLSTYGSRGDVEPMAGLAVALRALGAEALVSAPADAEFAELLARAGVPMVPAFMPVRDWVASARESGLALPALAARMAEAQYGALAAAAAGCDVVVATGLFPSVAAAQAVAEKRGACFAWAALCPQLVPSPHHPPMEYPGWPHPPRLTGNRDLWAFNATAMDGLFGEAVNGLRASLGLPALGNVRDHVFTRRPLLATDPVLGPWLPGDQGCDAVQTGAWLLPDTRPLPPGVEAFLAAGPPPIHVGFGSMAMQAAPDAARAAVAAARALGRRTLLARGWAGLAPADDGDDCLAVGDVNHQALFPRVAAIVHHGGAGTTLAAARAGVPQLVVPQVADQPYWAGRVAALGIGVAHDGPVPTEGSLAAGLAAALAPDTRARAAVVAASLRGDGAFLAAGLLARGE